MLWNKSLKTMMSDNDVEISIMMSRGNYLQKLFKIQNKPYFGSINFENKILFFADYYIIIKPKIVNNTIEIPAPMKPYGIWESPCSKLSQPHAAELIIVASE